MIKDYFKYYGSRELMIVGTWIKNNKLEDFVDEFFSANTGLHDVCVKLKNGMSFYVEIKEDSTFWFNKTGNIGLDYYSSFTYKNPAIRPKSLWISPEELEEFKTMINIGKRGKLFTCDAKLQIYFVDGILCKAYSNIKLQNPVFVNYLEKNYRLRINDKKSYGLKDSWQSSAYYVNPFKDKMLQQCEINTYDELIAILKGENNG